MRFYKRLIQTLAVAGVLLLPACTLGPNYLRPAATSKMPDTFKELDGWKVAQPQDGQPSERWWKIYNDPELNALEDLVVIDNQNIKSYEALYRQAQALVQATRAGYYPTGSVGASATRARTSDNTATASPGSEVSDFQIPLSFAWEADVWGRIRRSVEASSASAQASAADLMAAKLSAQSDLAVDYFQMRVLEAQKQLMDTTVACYQKSLELTRNRYDSGVAAKTDILQAETQLKNTQAQAIDLSAQIAKMEHAVALLVGRPASDFSLPEAPLVLQVPVSPVGLPSELLEHRPDIASAERKMVSANAQIGIAEAAYYPAIRLSATGGLDASNILNVISWPSRFWSVGPSVSETIFDGGLRKAQSQQAIAAYDQTVSFYRQTVLTAFQEVEDNLAALRVLAEEAGVQDHAVTSAKETVGMIENQYREGTVGYLNVIASQTTALDNERTALTIHGNRLTASVLLFKALGGGWSSAELPEVSSRNSTE